MSERGTVSSQNEVSAGGPAVPGPSPDTPQSERPGQPDQSKWAGQSDETQGPGQSDETQGPGQSDETERPGQPGQPEQPEEPGQAERPGQPGQLWWSQANVAGPAGSQPPADNQFGAAGQPEGRAPGKVSADGKTVYRRVTPIVLWWIWVVFLVFNVVQVIAPDHDYFSLELAAGLLTATGVAYATALRPRVIADSDGLVVHNPVADHVVRWGAVRGVYLGDSVELSCTRAHPEGEKTVYCWALYSGRRSRLKSQQLGVRSWGRMASRTPAGGSETEEQDTAQLIAAELGRRSTRARQAGVPAATVETHWAWLPIAGMVAPAVLLCVLLLIK